MEDNNKAETSTVILREKDMDQVLLFKSYVVLDLFVYFRLFAGLMQNSNAGKLLVLVTSGYKFGANENITVSVARGECAVMSLIQTSDDANYPINQENWHSGVLMDANEV
ncbi:hypothetical protein XENORESO_001441 [Xenotaenia resolanae]|uniref:Uncharacterized protein n=1 Tax=Xenotaenia resolanae TaxID=208358 RepID=A0ABV0X076_9TELE